MPGTKVRPSLGMRASDICPAFRQNSTAHWKMKKPVPERTCEPMPQIVTMSQPVIAPTNIVGTSLRNVSGFGPPAAKVPAQVTNAAQTGRLKGTNIVETASDEAATSTGSRFMASILLPARNYEGAGGCP